MLSKSDKILMSLNSKQKPLCQLTNTELLPQGDKEKSNTEKITKARLVLILVFFSLCNHAKPCFLAWWSLTAQAKGLFQDSKLPKMNRCIKSDKLRQTNCNDFLDNFVMKKAGQNFWTVHCVMFSLTWFDDCSFLFLYTHFKNDSISEI